MAEGVTLKRILVVDDDKSILRLVATILRREHYRVDTAGGGRDALSQLAVHAYDVVVLDLMMPGVSGLDVLASLRERSPGVKCVVIMSAASPLVLSGAITANVYTALSKPFDYHQLVGSVRECLESRDKGPLVPIVDEPAAA